MKCYYNRKPKPLYFRRNWMSTIHNSMSYEDVIYNVVALPDEMVPNLPYKVEQLLVRTQIARGRINFFLDTSSINEATTGDDSIAFTPLTEDLLKLYEKTPQQFIDDFFNAGVVGIAT